MDRAAKHLEISLQIDAMKKSMDGLPVEKQEEIVEKMMDLVDCAYQISVDMMIEAFNLSYVNTMKILKK